MVDDRLYRTLTIINQVKEAAATGTAVKEIGSQLSSLGGRVGQYLPHAALAYLGYKGYTKGRDKFDTFRVRQAQKKLQRAQQRRLIQASRQL